MLKKYSVEMTRIGYGSASIDVEARDEEAARGEAHAVSGDLSYSEKSADYEIESIVCLGEVFPMRKEGVPGFLEANGFENDMELRELVTYLRLDGKTDEVVLNGLHVFKAWEDHGGCPKYSYVRRMIDGEYDRSEWGDGWRTVFDAAGRNYTVQG